MSAAQLPCVSRAPPVGPDRSWGGLGEVLGDVQIDCPIYASAVEALLHRCDVFVEYTKPDSARANSLLELVDHGKPREAGGDLLELWRRVGDAGLNSATGV